MPLSGFRRLMVAALIAGALAGLVSFAIQHFTIVPLIKTAETYEKHSHEEAEWEPSEGWERTAYTGVATVLSGIGLAAVLFGSIGLAQTRLTPWRGLLFGLAGFICFGLAPAFGLPPQPPGVPVAELQARQLWWAGTALATAFGLWLLLASGRNFWRRGAGVLCLLLPHFIGAPTAPANDVVPARIVQQFVAASLGTSAIFWLLVGGIGGLLLRPSYRNPVV